MCLLSYFLFVQAAFDRETFTWILTLYQLVNPWSYRKCSQWILYGSEYASNVTYAIQCTIALNSVYTIISRTNMYTYICIAHARTNLPLRCPVKCPIDRWKLRIYIYTRGCKYCSVAVCKLHATFCNYAVRPCLSRSISLLFTHPSLRIPDLCHATPSVLSHFSLRVASLLYISFTCAPAKLSPALYPLVTHFTLFPFLIYTFTCVIRRSPLFSDSSPVPTSLARAHYMHTTTGFWDKIWCARFLSYAYINSK